MPAGRPRKIENIFKPSIRNIKTPVGHAGFDNPRENIDPQIKTKAIFLPYTLGSVLFIGTKGSAQEDNSNLFWDNTNKKFGIGTASPAGHLEIEKSDSNTIIAASTNQYFLNLQNIDATDNNWAMISNYGRSSIGAGIGFQNKDHSASQADIAFAARGSAGWGERMRITGNGNVGIGTTTPRDKFQVKAATDVNLAVEPAIGVANALTLTAANDAWDTNIPLEIRGNPTVFSIGKVGIGTASPATSAKVEISSTTGALLLPRMTTAQIAALTAVNGMLVYDSTLNQTQTYENGAWRQI